MRIGGTVQKIYLAVLRLPIRSDLAVITRHAYDGAGFIYKLNISG
jgi:hypothetical protein